jgi:hypothetical protein
MSFVTVDPANVTQNQFGLGSQAWTTPANIETSGASYATTGTLGPGTTMEDVDGYDFNAGLSGGDTINGLAVSASAFHGTVHSCGWPTTSCNIGLNGTTGVPGSQPSGNLATSATTVNWGTGSTDTCGLGAALTAANLNVNTTSGPVVGITVTSTSSANSNASINDLQLTIFYTAEASRRGHRNLLLMGCG